MNKLIAIIIASIISTGALAADDDFVIPAPAVWTTPVVDKDAWTDADTAREVTFLVVDAMDWRSTQDIRRHPNYYEINPILGEHPTNARINTYFAVTAASQYLIARALPADLRAAWQTAGIVMEVYWVHNNMQLGLKVGF